MHPFVVDDSVPMEDEIEWAVTQLRNHRSGGPSGMRAEHLKRWLVTARNSEKEKAEKVETTTERAGMTENGETSAEKSEKEAENWTMVEDLIHLALREVNLTEEATWQAVVLITKGNTDYRGIGLVEVMWKAVAAILNRRLTASITFHDFLHGFLAGRGTGTVTLDAKMLQKLATLREEVLYMIFLDLHKAYDALDRSRCLDILEGYGMGAQARRLLQTYWRRLTMVARSGGYYETAFKGERGVT